MTRKISFNSVTTLTFLTLLSAHLGVNWSIMRTCTTRAFSTRLVGPSPVTAHARDGVERDIFQNDFERGNLCSKAMANIQAHPHVLHELN